MAEGAERSARWSGAAGVAEERGRRVAGRADPGPHRPRSLHLNSIVHRITRAPYADLSGEGARLAGGRWNRPGRAAVYAAENRSLSVLESLVHLQPHRVPADLVVLSVEIPSDLPHETWAVGEFPAGWREIGAEWCLDRGDAWLDSGAAAVLWVPSAILPEERSAILNPRHPSHSGSRIIDRQPFSFDARLLALTAGRAGPRIHR